MNIDTAKNYIASCRWQFAKTMPKNPHEYTLKAWNEICSSKVEFEKFVTWIREEGYERPFYGKMYLSMDIDGWTYWTMGEPLNETILINRAKTPIARNQMK